MSTILFKIRMILLLPLNILCLPPPQLTRMILVPFLPILLFLLQETPRTFLLLPPQGTLKVCLLYHRLEILRTFLLFLPQGTPRTFLLPLQGTLRTFLLSLRLEIPRTFLLFLQFTLITPIQLQNTARCQETIVLLPNLPQCQVKQANIHPKHYQKFLQSPHLPLQ